MKRFLWFCLLLCACRQGNDSEVSSRNIRYEGKDICVSLIRKDSITIIHAGEASSTRPNCDWKLSYPIYRFDTGDVDGDGNEDILIGVVRKTRFDPKERKRLFLFKIYEGCIRPLWLGSRVSRPLQDFRFIREGGEAFIRTVESDSANMYRLVDYRWHGFGLDFVRYVEKNLPLHTALQHLNYKKV